MASRVMTSDDLVDAVSELSGRGPLVSSVEVIKWCARQKPYIDCGDATPRKYGHFEVAEKVEPEGKDRVR